MKKLLILLGFALTTLTCMGPAGHNGKDGKPGSQGPAGSSCSQTKLGATGISGDPAEYGGSIITCGDGLPTVISNGRPGSQGIQGSPGTSVTAVQFCPNYQLTYPSTFPEVGMCFSNVLYAVYWDKANLNAWLTEIPPGYYASTSTSAPCNFTVMPNCGVQ